MADYSKLAAISGPQTAQMRVDVIAAATSDELALWVNRITEKVRVTAIRILPDAATSGHATNKFTLSIQNKGLVGTGTTEVATLEFAAGVDFVAFDEKNLTLSATAANLLVDVNEVLTWKKADAAGGLEFPGGIITVEFEVVGDI